MYAKNPAPPAAHEQPWQEININKLDVVQILQLLAQPIDATHDRSAIRRLVGDTGGVLQQGSPWLNFPQIFHLEHGILEQWVLLRRHTCPRLSATPHLAEGLATETTCVGIRTLWLEHATLHANTTPPTINHTLHVVEVMLREQVVVPDELLGSRFGLRRSNLAVLYLELCKHTCMRAHPRKPAMNLQCSGLLPQP